MKTRLAFSFVFAAMLAINSATFSQTSYRDVLIPNVPHVKQIVDADYTQHILALKKKLPDEFSLFFERPFVVVGNGIPEDVKALCESTVHWAVEHLKRDYFKRDPNEIIT